MKRLRALLLLLIKLTFIGKILRRSILLAFCVIKDKEIIGICHIDMVKDGGKYGIVLTPFAQGHGLGKLLSIITIAYAFNISKLKYITLRVDVDNCRAINLYRRLGFRTIKTIKHCDKRNNRYVACHEMILTKKGFHKMLQHYIRTVGRLKEA